MLGIHTICISSFCVLESSDSYNDAAEVIRIRIREVTALKWAIPKGKRVNNQGTLLSPFGWVEGAGGLDFLRIPSGVADLRVYDGLELDSLFGWS